LGLQSVSIHAASNKMKSKGVKNIISNWKNAFQELWVLGLRRAGL
jgi:hypothetical protein